MFSYAYAMRNQDLQWRGGWRCPSSYTKHAIIQTVLLPLLIWKYSFRLFAILKIKSITLKDHYSYNDFKCLVLFKVKIEKLERFSSHWIVCKKMMPVSAQSGKPILAGYQIIFFRENNKAYPVSGEDNKQKRKKSWSIAEKRKKFDMQWWAREIRWPFSGISPGVVVDCVTHLRTHKETYSWWTVITFVVYVTEGKRGGKILRGLLLLQSC